jgi:hypothetical protein
VIQGTFGVIQGTFGVIQGTFGVIQGTSGVIISCKSGSKATNRSGGSAWREDENEVSALALAGSPPPIA